MTSFIDGAMHVHGAPPDLSLSSFIYGTVGILDNDECLFLTVFLKHKYNTAEVCRKGNRKF